MEKGKIEYFREKLIALRDKLVAEVATLERETLNRSPKDRAGDLSGYSIHLADAASDSYDRDFTLLLASREQEMLNKIENALEKMEGGKYGQCELCPELINEGRLEAVPYAELCIGCKKREEKKQAKE